MPKIKLTRYIPIPEAADRIGVSETDLHELITTSKIQAAQSGNG